MNGLELIAKKIDEELGVIREDTAMGKAVDFGAYKYGCGIYRGLLIAKAIVADLQIRMDEEYDD